jgi:hypothetical protein
MRRIASSGASVTSSAMRRMAPVGAATSAIDDAIAEWNVDAVRSR